MDQPPRIIVTRRLPDAIEHHLVATWGAQLNRDDIQLDEKQLTQAMANADILLCTLTDPLNARVLDAQPRSVKLLANFGVGYNHIDLAAARRIGLPVTNTPGVLTEDTADLTMLLMLAVARRAWEGNAELRRGAWTGWRPTHLLGRRVSGKTLGIVGFGRIGQAVARRACNGFGMNVLYTSRTRASPEAEHSSAARYVPELRELLSQSDFVSLHCPATAETRHLIGPSEFDAMQPGAFLINTARGDVVDEAALIAALEGGKFGGAALDVYDGEPRVHASLLQFPQVVTLPHLGSATIESREAMGWSAVRNIEAFLRKEPLPDRVA